MKIKEIRDILKAEVLVGHRLMDQVVSGGGAADLMEDILSAATKGALILTGLTSEKVIQTAQIAEAGAVLFVRGKRPSDTVIELARSIRMPILLTEHSLFVACGRLYMNGLMGLDGSW